MSLLPCHLLQPHAWLQAHWLEGIGLPVMRVCGALQSSAVCMVLRQVMACRYDPVSDRWTIMKPMSTPRFALASAVLKGSMVCVGGFDGQRHLASSELYDARAGRCESGHYTTFDCTSCLRLTEAPESYR